MAKKFIDEQGLRTLWNQSKNKFVSKESLELKKYNLNMNGADWITLAKVTDVSLNSSALFSINCYGVKEQNRIILTTSVFNISVGLDEDKNIISSVLPISQTPEIQLSGDSGSSSVGSGGSANSAVYGLSNIAFEKYDENTIYVMGLISFPATDQYDSLDVEMRLDDNLNFEYLESLEIIYKQEDDTLQEGTQIYVKGDYVNYYMRGSLDLMQQQIDSVDTYGSGNYAFITYKREDGHLGNNVLMYNTSASGITEYYICGITNVISEYFGLAKDYEKFRNQETISIPIQLGVEFNLFNILKEYIDKEVINDSGKGYKVELHKYYNPGGVKINYNGLGDDYSFIIEEVGRSQFAILIDSSNYQLRNCDKNTPNYIINAYDSLGEKLEDGTIYLNVFMNPNFFIIDFIFNYLNQFPNGQKLEITQVNVLPLRYMGGTKVENYSQSYELYNPYKRLDMLSDGNIINKFGNFTLNRNYTNTFISLGYNGYENGNPTNKGVTVEKFNEIVHIDNFNLVDDTSIKNSFNDYILNNAVFTSVDKMQYVTGGVPIPLFYAEGGVFDSTGGYGSSIINIKLNNVASNVWAYTGTIQSYDVVKKILYFTNFSITESAGSISSFYCTKTSFYPPDITTDENGNVTDISINGTSISTKDYTDATFVPISTSSTDSTVGDSTLSNTNGEVLINTNKSGYKVETKSSGANLTVEAGLVTGTPTTTVKVNPNGVTINDEKVATEPYVEEAVANLVNSAPEALNTLKELSTALGDDPNFATTVANQIGTKANDSSVVHLTGDETIIGNKTFNATNKYNGYNIFNGVVRTTGDKECITFPTGAILANDNELKLYTHHWYNTFGNSSGTYGLKGAPSTVYDLSTMVRSGVDQWGIAGGKSWVGHQYYNCKTQFEQKATFLDEAVFNNKITNKMILGGVMELHPEGNNVIFPAYMNDLAFLQLKGGSCIITGVKTNNESTNSRLFNGKNDYSHYTLNATTDVVTILIKSPKMFYYNSRIGISFGSINWRAKNIKIEIGYAATTGGDPADSDWKTVAEKTDNVYATYATEMVTGPTSTGMPSTPWNTIRITLTDFENINQFRIASIFAYNYDSESLNTTLLGKGGGEMYGNLMPYKDKGTSLGYADKQFKDIYAETGHFNAIVPFGNDTGSIGNSASKWWAVRAHYINGDALQENGVNIRNIFSERKSLVLGRNSTTGITSCCSFFTITFDTTWKRSYFTLDVKDIESGRIDGRYLITFNVQDATNKITCNIRQVYMEGKNRIEIFAIQNENILTFYLKLITISYCNPILFMRDFILAGGSYEFKAGTWATEIPEATFIEDRILDERYFLKTGGFISGSILPDATETYNLGSNSNRFSYIFSRILNVSNVEGNYIFPRTTGTGSVGTPQLTYNLMYANNYYENGVKLEDKYVPITASSSTSGVGDSTLSNSNGEVLISTNKQGYKVETKSSGANLTIEAGTTADTPTTSFKVNPNGVYINDEQIATKKYQHNIHLTGAVDSTGVTRAIITFSFINNVSTAYTTVRGNLDTALYNAGFNSSTKLCNASGNFIPNASSNYSAMGVSGSSASGITVYGNYGQTSNGNLTLGTATAIIGYYNVTVTDTVIEI